MTSLRDCLEEVIGKGSGLFVRSYAIPGAYRRSEWEPGEFLTELQRESPGVLEDGAWGEWVTRRGMGLTFFIHYGQQGFSLSHQEVPGYGHLRVLEVSQRYARDTALSNVGRPGRF
ncbi:MAG: hypothetical protein ACLQUY_22650 [Ktedonobacterales bacterium]